MHLELFYRENCPYSLKVRDYLNRKGLEKKIELMDVDEEPEYESTLWKLNNDDQVPCLVVDGSPILESNDIIDWLEENRSKI